ncbi:MAG: ATP-dependent 6-phosphofructokinase, partial [Deltaproteobacteria bacterium]|nr:ATP-dependent 6-phosphofructokinase [Deltaproteobacteria bacterium]
NKTRLLGIDALVAIGGEDTLGVAAKLHRKFDFPVVGIPKTIDRDLSGTEYSLGFESSVQIICEAIDNLRTTAGSHSRIFVVETMGRHTGHLALKGGLAGGANAILIPEYSFDVNEVCVILLARKLAGQRYSIVVVSEGAKERNGGEILKDQALDEFGHVKLGGIGHYLADKIEKITKLETRYVILSHLQRGGSPAAYDRRMGYYFGTAAVEAVLAQKFGTLTALVSGRVNLIPLEDAISKLRYVDVERDYDTEKYNYKQQILY